MKPIIRFNSFLVYSEENKKYFFSYFKNKINIIYGKNTSGKSTLIQLILYSFGINDNKIKLAEILSEEIFVRLDFTVKRGEREDLYTFIRTDETLAIQENRDKVVRFNGIGNDHSQEHIKLKKYLSNMLNFSLELESNSGITNGPIETMFLPYYVSQDVGWVYLRKSFSNLNFYRKFKEDFLDYYLGIENAIDRQNKRKIENEIKIIQQKINFYIDIEKNNQDFELSKILDDSISGKANELLEKISSRKDETLSIEKEYVKESNKLSFLTQRLSVVSKVKRNHKNQVPGRDKCPTCSQILPKSIEKIYGFFQEENDSISLFGELKEKIKKSQSKINSLNKKLIELRTANETDHKIFNKYSESNITIENYIGNKATVYLHNNLVENVGKLNIELEAKRTDLTEYKTDQEIYTERAKKEKIFKDIFLENNLKLKLPHLSEERFYKLYDISSFPFQGVQLHLAVLSYHFSFNYLISKTHYAHRLPFILDSIFKEDIEGGNKELI
ncbi:hypothetical protein JWG39_13050 [Desulforhopalus vacuolatus]|uniref:hypothetical protein n=1 Tax=Desulforhopalus vacuolatus TaxID=40414 RepID=UPI001964CBA6|nr:hypothetical protein [Desulforhopalus vacuolatus]MBM9520743.1 hypothetical protein [Desulforhopalus vacuolatus]